ncbi:MAG TPA: ABC transporter substrate-binding protein [Nitrospira sp.]|nr:ABC transporter substrate-binding protein [Nitrospira sp.]HNC82317.1 ABC transporter substrate-binding protein [Nitrospira sp.]HNG00341.1 ABC transporter substrate-binding protein [Nitrospira sp.]
MRRLIHLIAALGIALTLSALGLIASPDSACAESGRIVVLSGQDLKPYQDVLAGLQQSLTKQGINLAVEIHAAQGAPSTANVLEDIKKNGARLVVTLGSAATQAAVREVGQVPILATMIVTADDIKSASNATAVLLDFPLDLQMQWLHRIVPAANTVGVLFNPKENQTKVNHALRIAKENGLSLVTQAVDTPRALPDALENLSRHVDALWGISDSVVMTPQTAEPILLSTLRNKVPLAGLSASWVKAGALYALDRDYLDIGNQCGDIAGKILGGTSASSLAPIFPRKVTYSVNLKTAGAMNLELPQDVVRGATHIFQ